MHLGFVLNVVPLKMKAIVKMVLEQNELTMKASLEYVNNIYVNKDILQMRLRTS